MNESIISQIHLAGQYLLIKFFVINIVQALTHYFNTIKL